MNNPVLEQLESRVRSLVDKINKLRADNHRLHDELALSRQELSMERSKQATTAVVSVEQSELQKTLEHQSQEIQLLEKERLNLRDQIAFLQNTIQNKEKDWKDKNEHIRLDLDNQLQESQKQLLASQERISNLELKLQVLQTDAEQVNVEFEAQKNRVLEAEGSLKNYQKNIESLEQQLLQAQDKLIKQQQANKVQIEELQSQFETRLTQETERFRMEYALLGKQHEQNLSDLTQALNQQKERLRTENIAMQEKLQKVQQQSQRYRDLLAQSVVDIRALLVRLPQSESASSQIDET